MSTTGTVNTNEGYPFYKQKNSDNYMWWMWHGSVGHWVVNKTPGSHGGDRVKSVFDEFKCPQNVSQWEVFEYKIIKFLIRSYAQDGFVCNNY